MKLEDLERQQKLIKELREGLDAQHDGLLDLLGILLKYSESLLEEVKSLREEQ